jgi:hypothetical protein
MDGADVVHDRSAVRRSRRASRSCARTATSSRMSRACGKTRRSRPCTTGTCGSLSPGCRRRRCSDGQRIERASGRFLSRWRFISMLASCGWRSARRFLWSGRQARTARLKPATSSERWSSHSNKRAGGSASSAAHRAVPISLNVAIWSLITKGRWEACHPSRCPATAAARAVVASWAGPEPAGPARVRRSPRMRAAYDHREG